VLVKKVELLVGILLVAGEMYRRRTTRLKRLLNIGRVELRPLSSTTGLRDVCCLTLLAMEITSFA